jgi:hypothetical protein
LSVWGGEPEHYKGPESEQLEFVQALRPAKKTFETAIEIRQRMLAANRG